MSLTGKYFADYQSFQATFDGLHFFNTARFQTNGSQGICYFFRL